MVFLIGYHLRNFNIAIRKGSTSSFVVVVVAVIENKMTNLSFPDLFLDSWFMRFMRENVISKFE